MFDKLIETWNDMTKVQKSIAYLVFVSMFVGFFKVAWWLGLILLGFIAIVAIYNNSREK